ncbi:NRPS7 [Symbiodinium natans]|uniref:NRPS7 protein n=1 Tax=Symbiodinium natans TaxID=878477 RepID=A0A812I999_9DINO|nr:NRPS7 [Symbiodinium natans]
MASVTIADRGPPLRYEGWSTATVAASFAAAADRWATATALAGGDSFEGLGEVEGNSAPKVLSYASLRALVASTAVRLHAASEGLERDRKEVMVALFVDEAAPLVVAMLAILWAGLCFVPVDLAAWPYDRCRYVLDVSGAALALASEARREAAAGLLGADGGCALVMLEDALAASSQAVSPLLSAPADVAPEDLAYAIFTSGSTGRPKCVLCEHRAAVAYAWAKAQEESLGPGSRQLLGSHFTFDPAQGDVFGALTLGATLVTLPRSTVLGALHDALGLDVTHATMTPTQWSLKAPGPLPELQNLTLCGETMRVDTIETWSPALALRNMYGVTEATGLQTSHRVVTGDSPKLVGYALPGYVVALSEEGEILLAGRGLARGYLGREEETRRRFVDFRHALDDTTLEARAYCTGDLGLMGPQGLVLKGRRDHQVKISGVRIELSEVELAVLAAGIASACTVVVAQGVLVAHVALGDHTFDWILRATLEACAAARLPKEVVPHHFQPHVALPLAAGGKVDRQALEALGLPRGPEAAPGGPATTALEAAVAVAWASALRRPTEELGRGSNFLWLGGDSLAALRACRALREEVRSAALVEPQDLDVQQEQRGEAGLLVEAEAPPGALCVLSAALGPLAPCELMARPTLQQYAAFLEEEGIEAKGAEGPVAGYPAVKTAAGPSAGLPTDGEEPLAKMAGVDDRGAGGSAELALAAAAREGREELVKALLQVGTSPNGSARGMPPRGYTPLHAACAAGQEGVVAMLLDARANVRSMTEARTSPAQLAAAQGDAATLARLLAVEGAEGVATWARDVDQQTILHLAARSGEVKAVETVLVKVKGLRAKDGGLEAKDRWSRTALEWAVANGHEEAAVCLIRNGAFSGGIPDALLENYQVDLSAPSKPGQPKAARKEVQPDAKIASLVSSLPSSAECCEEKQLFALTALRDFCCGAKEHRDAARRSGAVGRLLALLSGQRSEVVAAAAQTLRNIAADRPGATALCEEGGVALLLDVVKRGENSPEAWRAASALANIAEFAELAPVLREAGAVPELRSLSGQLPSSLQ